MKRFSYYLITAFFMLVLAAGCTQDDYLHYDTDTASLRFSYTAGSDSLIYSFRLHPGTSEGKVEIPVRLIGLAVPQTREFSVEVDKEKSTAIENTDFVIEHSEIEADSIKGVLNVTLKKTAAIDNGKLYVTLRLCPNEFFGSAPVNQSAFTIVISNELIAPEGWIFDEYSQVKHEFVIEHTGVATNYYTVWSNSEKIWWKSKLINALYEYNLAHPDAPLKDENGLLVTF